MLLFIKWRFLAPQWINGCNKTEIVSKKKKCKRSAYVKNNTIAYGLSCQCGSCATIKQHISTPVIYPVIAMVAKHVLVSHSSCNFIVNV